MSHGNTARLANYHGDSQLAKVCGFIAADEGRHEAAYSSIVEQLFDRDPEGAVLAFADMMKKGIVMPAHFMDDGWHSQPDANPGQNLFVDYATVADAIGVYTTADYADIVQHLVRCEGQEASWSMLIIFTQTEYRRLFSRLTIAGAALGRRQPAPEQRACFGGSRVPVQAFGAHPQACRPSDGAKAEGSQAWQGQDGGVQLDL